MKVKKQLSLQQAQVGQVLADDLYDAQNHCLMAAGVILDAIMLKHLQERGIERLFIWVEQSLNKIEIEVQQKVIKGQLAHCFRQMQDEPVMNRLHDMLLAYHTNNNENNA